MRRRFFSVPGHLHFLTFGCYNHRQLLNDDIARRVLAECIAKAKIRDSLKLYAWVFMPEHVHLLLHPTSDIYSMSRILQAIKGNSARKIIAVWKEKRRHMLGLVRIDASTDSKYRFWQTGGGFDRNLYGKERIQRAVAYIEYNPVRRELVREPSEWEWSSAAGANSPARKILKSDEIEFV